MILIIASNNNHKIKEIKQILGGYFTAIISQQEAGIKLDVEETGSTFEENAIIKAKAALDEYIAIANNKKMQASVSGNNYMGKDGGLFCGQDEIAALADDSGLMVDALGGEPGIYSARYAGSGQDDAKNNEKLLYNLRNVKDNDRKCAFVSAVALLRVGYEPVCLSGKVEGVLLRQPLGKGGFGYDPLFLYQPLGLTFAQMSQEQKNGISHRKKALKALEDYLINEKRGGA